MKFLVLPALLAALAIAGGCGHARRPADANPGSRRSAEADASPNPSASPPSASPSSASPSSASPSPFIPNGPARDAVVWAFGDAVPGPGAGRVARLISRARADYVLYLGDVYPAGTASAFRNGYARVFGRFARRTAPTPGNHDWPDRAAGYNRYWRRVHGRTPPRWYSFTAGGWRLIELNSEIVPSAAQLRWLRELVGRTPGTCSLAFWHRPRFSAGPHGDDRAMDPYWRALEGHATLVVSGHDHDMERLMPVGGITQLVSGAGGHSHYRLRRERRLAFGDARHYGALRIELRAGWAGLEFMAPNGAVLDASRVDCRE